MRHDKTLDVFKGLLVIAMVYCHVLQFFGDSMLFPIERAMETTINLTIFPGFVFAFGWAIAVAYLSKSFKSAVLGMVKASLRPLGAFYLSGIAFRVLRENKPLAAGTVWNIFTVQDIPGWSEFLIAFALYGLLAIALFVPLKRLRERPLWAIFAGAVCLLGCFLPYESIKSPHVGLFIGTENYVTFPVLQHAPYFLIGIVFPLRKKEHTWIWALCAVVCTAVGGILWQAKGEIPNRFPPEIGWILLPAGIIAALLTLAWGLCRIVPIKRFDVLFPLESMGRNSLFYLLFTNIVLFTFSGKNILPWLKTGSWIWGQPIQSPVGAFLWTLIFLAVCGFIGLLVKTRPKVRRAAVPDDEIQEVREASVCQDGKSA